MRIRLASNLGGGGVRDFEVPEGTTVRDLCLRESHDPNFRFEAFLIQVKRQEVEPTYRLSDGDSVVMTPRGIRGAYHSSVEMTPRGTRGASRSEEPDEVSQSLEDIADLKAIELAEQAAEWISWDELKQEIDPAFLIGDLAVETGVPDLAVNHDHYLYGHPKVDQDR